MFDISQAFYVIDQFMRYEYTNCNIMDERNCFEWVSQLFDQIYLRNKYCICGDCDLIYRRGIFI